jgi:hypothetical protein
MFAGVAFVITFVVSIPGALLLAPVLKAGYIAGGGADKRVLLGGLLEMFLIVANIASAIILFPLLKRQNERLALGYVAARLVESGFIAIGIVSYLSIVTLRHLAHQAGADPATFAAAGQSLVAVRDWTFLLGPGFVVGIGNGLMLGYLMYKSGLVPRRMAILGLVGGPLVCLSGIAVLFGAYAQVSAPSFLATLPEIAWEGSLGIYLIVKGFRPSVLISGEPQPAPALAAA